jgi:hypothetical protein
MLGIKKKVEEKIEVAPEVISPEAIEIEAVPEEINEEQNLEAPVEEDEQPIEKELFDGLINLDTRVTNIESFLFR